MTTGIIFEFKGEKVEVRLESEICLFRKLNSGGILCPIEKLRIDKKGVIKEFPDLKDNEEWREEAIKRFKEKLKSYKTERERIDYIINDLIKFGYIPLYSQVQGHRPKRVKWQDGKKIYSTI